MTWDFRRIMAVIVSALRPGRFCHVHSHSLEASRSRLGIAERDDTGWFPCIVGASRKGPLRARRDHYAAFSRQSWCCSIGGNNLSTPTRRLGLRVNKAVEPLFPNLPA